MNSLGRSSHKIEECNFPLYGGFSLIFMCVSSFRHVRILCGAYFMCVCKKFAQRRVLYGLVLYPSVLRQVSECLAIGLFRRFLLERRKSRKLFWCKSNLFWMKRIYICGYHIYSTRIRVCFYHHMRR